ncbi:MAG: hypothetical protein NC133_00015 [Prevotella sp.]|nr:hypothetical protein [Prevotella sp.]
MLKFGTSGIRDLTKKLLTNHVGAQIAEKLSALGWQEVTIGRDGRTGSEKLMNEFIKYFSGIVHNLGITTTPELAAQNGLSIMITASHNPCQYCGFKIYLNHFEQSTLELPPVPVYHKWDLLPKDIIIDCANGGLGYKLHSLGFNNLVNYKGEINQGCGATHPEFLTQYCQEHHLEIGFAVDGDADRLLMYLGDRVLSSEEVAILLATLLNLSSIVVDETVNSALERNFQLVRSKVGGQNMIHTMQNAHINFGAEKSGHYYFDSNLGTSDAIDAMILIADAYHDNGISGLRQILKNYRPYYQFIHNVNIEKLPDNYASIIENFNLPHGIRQVIRKSGTEPLLRIMLEGKKENAVMKVWHTLAAQLNIQ